MVLDRLIVGNMQENCYIIGDPTALLVIDPGDESEKIVAHIRENGYQVAYVVLTHCHYDHVGAVNEVIAATGAKLLLAAAEKENYSNRHVNLCGYFAPMPTLPEPDMLLFDGDVIESGDFGFRVITTPGHTGGSICLLCDRVLISGDTLFYRSIGRADFPTGSLKDLVFSVKEKLFTLKDDVKVYPGHGEATSIGFEREFNEVYEWEKHC